MRLTPRSSRSCGTAALSPPHPTGPVLPAVFVPRATGHGSGHSTEPGTAASIGTASSKGLARWHRKVVLQHYIHSHVMCSDISDMLPLKWLRAELFQKPKQRKPRRFPLMLRHATSIHFLQKFCQKNTRQARFLLAILSREQMTRGHAVQLGFHLEESSTQPTLRDLLLALIGTVSVFASFCAHRHVLAESDGIYFTCISISNILKVCNTYAGHHFKYIYDLERFLEFWTLACFAVILTV